MWAPRAIPGIKLDGEQSDAYTNNARTGLLCAFDFRNQTVQKNESTANQSIAGIVSSKPGTLAIKLDLTGTVTDTGTSQSIRDEVRVVVG